MKFLTIQLSPLSYHFLTGRYILFNTTFPNTSNVCSSFSVTSWCLKYSTLPGFQSFTTNRISYSTQTLHSETAD